MSTMTRRALLAAAALAPACAFAQSPSAPDAHLYIIWPQDGQRIKGAFWCRFGLRNMGIAPAGNKAENAGHHHLLIDAPDTFKPGDVIPADRNHVHFGAGQSEARVDLPPGRHTLQLVLGDAEHKVFNPPVVSKKITITIY